MSKDEYGYVEHQLVEVDGFRVVDATSTGLRPHDDLVWVGYGGVEGSWITSDDALALAVAITTVATGNLVRRGQLSADVGVRHRHELIHDLVEARKRIFDLENSTAKN